MDPKDELLAKLRAIDAEAAPPATEPELKPVSPPSSSAAEVHPEISTEAFLAKLDALDQDTRPAPPPTAAAVTPPPLPPRPVSSSRPKPKSPPSPTSTAPPSSSSAARRAAEPRPVTSSPIPNISQQLPWQPLAEAFGQLKRYTQAQIEARAVEAEARQKREAEIARAQAWLDELDPLSDDGFWFEQFSERYESRIQAAMDFLNPGRPEA